MLLLKSHDSSFTTETYVMFNLLQLSGGER